MLGPMTQSPQQPPAGWYPDPAGGSGERFWDGQAWSQSTRDKAAPAPQQAPQHGGWQEQPSTQAPQQRAQGPHQGAHQHQQQPPMDPRLGPYGGGMVKQVPAQGGFAIAGFWWRLLGYVIDGFIVGMVDYVLTMGITRRTDAGLENYMMRVMQALVYGSGDIPMMPTALILDMLLLMAITITLWGAYRTVLVATMGATLGQKICGLKVARLGDEQLQPVGWKTAAIRGFSGAILYRLIGFFAQITVLFLDRRQTVPDLLSKTVVVNTREAV